MKLSVKNIRERFFTGTQDGFPKGWLVLGVVVLIAFGWLFSPPPSREKKPAAKSAVAETPSRANSNQAMFLGEDVERKAFVERLEKQYDRAQRRQEAMAQSLKTLSARLNEISKGQEVLGQSLKDMQDKNTRAAEDLASDAKFGDSRYSLELVTLAEGGPKTEGKVFLPAGSFVRGTLLTGVYAPAGGGEGLPVLVRLNEAFIGPNDAAIPLQGAFVLGKATGDLNSRRAYISVIRLSTVFPSGEHFETQGDLGYLTDERGQLGLGGVLVRNTGSQLAASFMSGFAGGAAQALAESETSSTEEDGRVRRSVTGNVMKHAAFSGMAQSATQLSAHYQRQLETIVPAVRVEAGAEVYLVIREGIGIYGLDSQLGRGYHVLD